MAIELKEYVGAVFLKTNANKNEVNLSEGYTQTYIDDNSLMVDIEAIHSIITRNDTLYTPECIKDSIPYWTAPYERPVIMHHNEKDGKIIGRVKAANYIDNSNRSNSPALELIANVGDEDGKNGIKNGTLATVSIGAIAHDIRCSICGTNLVEEGMCEHEKGDVYDNKRCYWIVNKIEPKEVSYVIVPSDIYAHNTRVYDATSEKKKNKNEVNESMANIFADLIEAHGLNDLSVEEGATETQEGTQIDEEVKADAKVADDSKVEGEKGEEDKTVEDPETEPKEESEEDKKQEEQAEEESKDPEVDKTEGEKEDEPKVDEASDAVKEDKELATAKEEIKKLTDEVATLKAENEKLAQQVKNEKALKESAEAELIGLKAEKKKALIENVNSLRTQLQLPQEDANALMESTEESLNLSIKTLTECIQVQKKTLNGVTLIESPVAVSEAKDNTIKEKNKVEDVKESTEDSNIDFEGTLLDILSRCM